MLQRHKILLLLTLPIIKGKLFTFWASFVPYIRKCLEIGKESHQCVKDCQNNWKKHGNYCYFWSEKDAKRTWDNAEKFCMETDSHLASVSSEAKHKYISSEKEKRKLKNLWIGGTDKETQRVWKWMDGSEWNFTNWYEKQPSDGKGQDCLKYMEDKRK